MHVRCGARVRPAVRALLRPRPLGRCREIDSRTRLALTRHSRAATSLPTSYPQSSIPRASSPASRALVRVRSRGAGAGTWLRAFGDERQVRFCRLVRGSGASYRPVGSMLRQCYEVRRGPAERGDWPDGYGVVSLAPSPFGRGSRGNFIVIWVITDRYVLRLGVSLCFMTGELNRRFAPSQSLAVICRLIIIICRSSLL